MTIAQIIFSVLFGYKAHQANAGASERSATAPASMGEPGMVTSFPWEGLYWEARDPENENDEATTALLEELEHYLANL